MNSSANQSATRVPVWDLPMRIFHWTLAAAVVVAIATAKLGGNWMDLHGKAGLTIVGLLAFRLAWGVVGSTHARFRNFVPTPAKIRTYLMGRWQGRGHNPLGALAVYALLGLLTVQVATGLVANDDIAFNGPLFLLVDKSLSDKLSWWHHQLSNLLLILLGLHVAAILFYARIKKKNLVKPMLTGWAEGRAGESVTQGGPVALISSILIALVTVYGVSNASIADATAPSVPAGKHASW